MKQLKDNPFTILQKIKGEAVDWFLKHEYLFVNARKNNSLADYWLYLETMLSHNRAKKQVMDTKFWQFLVRSIQIDMPLLRRRKK